MCGITGFINLDQEPASETILNDMNKAIIHRGPDGIGSWIENNVGIGHTRLAILDLSNAAKQPMTSSNNRFVLTYNGEIYNFKEIKSYLEEKGFEFKSNTDSEVVLNAFCLWGTKAFKKFNGMFALGIWDRKKEILTIARDRYGIKPLYYARQGSKFLFGSEQKAITANPAFNRMINKHALLEYFTFQNIFTDQTFFNNINLLPAGTFAKFSAKKKKIDIKRYWDYDFSNSDKNIKENEYVEELDRLFEQAVNRHLLSDVELGTYLSGGMDSGSITAVASKAFTNLKSFTVGFDLSSASGVELNFDERIKAEYMSSYFKTEHYQMVLKAGDMERCLPVLTNHLEEPRVGQSYPNFYAAKLASKFVKVVLSGCGGDELFGGYPWRYYYTNDCKNFEEFVDRYYLYWQRLIPNSEISKVFLPIWSDVKDVWTRDIFKNVFNNKSKELKTEEDAINSSLYFEAKTFLHGLFVVEDKLSMAHGLETRVPFMDNELVNFAMSCPVNLKVNKLGTGYRINENEHGDKKNRYFRKTNDGKQILRKIMSRHLPKHIAHAEKQGFSSPDASWFKGESIDFVKKILFQNDAPIYSFLDRTAVKNLIDQHLYGKKNRRLLIWSLLYFNQWIETNL